MDNAAVIEGTITKMVYETSDKILTLCYEFIDDSDCQLDFICVEDLLQTVWTPVSPSLQQSVNSINSLQKQNGSVVLLFLSLYSLKLSLLFYAGNIKAKKSKEAVVVSKSVIKIASTAVISNVSNTKQNIVDTPKANVVVKRKASFVSVYGPAASIFNPPVLADGAKRTRRNNIVL